MAHDFTVQTKISRPVSDVFDAVVNDKRLCRYFADESSGPLVEGQKVVWQWQEWGSFPVQVTKVVTDRLIELQLDSTDWKKTEDNGYKVTVTFEFEALSDNETMLSISEAGWHLDEPSGRKASYENCGGWQHMALCLKASLEHDIDLR